MNKQVPPLLFLAVSGGLLFFLALRSTRLIPIVNRHRSLGGCS